MTRDTAYWEVRFEFVPFGTQWFLTRVRHASEPTETLPPWRLATVLLARYSPRDDAVYDALLLRHLRRREHLLRGHDEHVMVLLEELRQHVERRVEGDLYGTNDKREKEAPVELATTNSFKHMKLYHLRK